MLRGWAACGHESPESAKEGWTGHGGRWGFYKSWVKVQRACRKWHFDSRLRVPTLLGHVRTGSVPPGFGLSSVGKCNYLQCSSGTQVNISKVTPTGFSLGIDTCYKASAPRRMDTHSYDHSCILIVSESKKPRDQIWAQVLIFLQKRQKWLKRWHSHSIPKRVIANTAQLGTRVEAKAEGLKEESELYRFYTCVYDSKHWKCKWRKKRSLFPTMGALSTPERPTAPQQMKAASPPLPQLLEQLARSRYQVCITSSAMEYFKHAKLTAGPNKSSWI